MLLPFIGQTQTGALIGLFLFYITFEYVMVSHIPLMTELVPSARVTMLSMNVTGHAIGRALGAFLAGSFTSHLASCSLHLPQSSSMRLACLPCEGCKRDKQTLSVVLFCKSP
jgi:predicted MFS family arabinose efflux permease